MLTELRETKDMVAFFITPSIAELQCHITFKTVNYRITKQFIIVLLTKLRKRKAKSVFLSTLIRREILISLFVFKIMLFDFFS